MSHAYQIGRSHCIVEKSHYKDQKPPSLWLVLLPLHKWPFLPWRRLSIHEHKPRGFCGYGKSTVTATLCVTIWSRETSRVWRVYALEKNLSRPMASPFCDLGEVVWLLGNFVSPFPMVIIIWTLLIGFLENLRAVICKLERLVLDIYQVLS